MGNCSGSAVWATDGAEEPNSQSKLDKTRPRMKRHRGARTTHGSSSEHVIVKHQGQNHGASAYDGHDRSGAEASTSGCCPSSFSSQNCLKDSYSLGKQLGAGRFGVVRDCVRRSDGEEFACKIIAPAGAREASVELDVLRRMKNVPGVVQLECSFEDPKTGDVQIVMQKCKGGTLAELLDEKGHLSEDEAATAMQTILKILDAFHSQGLIHRDVKDTNFMLLRKDVIGSPIVAIDFGLATPWEPGRILQEPAGSPLFLAPEVVRRSYGPQCDVWSAGMLLHRMLSGRLPFGLDEALTSGGKGKGLPMVELLKRVTSGPPVDTERLRAQGISTPACDVVSLMLTRNPDKRPTPRQLLDHPWLQQHGQLNRASRREDVGPCDDAVVPQSSPQ